MTRMPFFVRLLPRVLWPLGIVFLTWTSSLSAPGAPLKVALVTPEGSTWTRILQEMTREVTHASQGRLKFKIYAGGVSGDERAVIRKMRVGLVHMAGFSGVGLGDILPEVRILEAPLLFRNAGEIDYVKSQLYDRFAARFEAQGYTMLGFAEAGFVYFFLQSAPAPEKGLKGVKMWAWKGDPVAKQFLDSFRVTAVPLHVMDVNTGLETGMLEAFYAPPLAAVAFQWYAKVNYFMDYPMVNSTGALLIRKKDFDGLPPDLQALLIDKARLHCARLVANSRQENSEALKVIQSSGIRALQPSPRQIQAFEESAREVYRKSIPALYDQALFDEVQTLLEAYRKTASQGTRP